MKGIESILTQASYAIITTYAHSQTLSDSSTAQR